MKKIFLLLVLIINTNCILISETILGGVISENAIWDDTGNPYIVTKNTLVKQGVKVKIDPGVIVKFNSNIYLQVDGELQAFGNSDNSITFTGGKIFITEMADHYDDTLKKGVWFDYCVFKNPSGICIQGDYSNIKVSHSEIYGGFEFNWGGSNIILKNKFYGGLNCFADPYKNQDGLVILDSNEFISTQALHLWFSSEITNNKFNNGDQCLRIYSPKAIISNNHFSNYYLAISIERGDNYEVTYNTFENNFTNVIITCEKNILMENNNFLSYKTYNLMWKDFYSTAIGCKMPQGSGTYIEIDVRNNYWGDLKTEEEIEESIFHFNDDFSVKGLFIFEPYLGAMAYKDSTVNIKEEIINQKNYNLYPNPAYEKFRLQISLSGSSFVEVDISNCMGMKLKSEQFQGQNETELDVSDLPSGLYFATIRSGVQVQTEKFVVVR